MASEQLTRRDDDKQTQIHVEKDRVPQLASHFEAISKPTDSITLKKNHTIPQKTEDTQMSGGIAKVTEDEKPQETPHELAAQFESLADKVRDSTNIDRRQAGAPQKQSVSEQRISGEAKGKEETGDDSSKQRISDEMGSHQNQPTLEEISNYRALSQERSNEAIRAAKERYDSKTEEEEEEEQRHRVEKEGGQQAQTGVKETLTTAAKTAAEKAKDYTVTAGQTTAHFIGEKAVAAKDVAIESGKVAAGYAGKAAEDMKEKAVVAGWSTAHYSCEKAVEGTKAAGRMVKGAAEYAGSVAAKPLCAAKNVAESAGENVKEYTGRKKEEAKRESMKKKGEKEWMYEKRKESFEEEKEEEEDDGGGILGAIGETIYEIAQTTKEIVIGGGDDEETGKQSNLGFEPEKNH